MHPFCQFFLLVISCFLVLEVIKGEKKQISVEKTSRSKTSLRQGVYKPSSSVRTCFSGLGGPRKSPLLTAILMKYTVHFFRLCKVLSVDESLTLTVVHEGFPSSLYSMLYPLMGPFKLVVLGVYDMNLT